MAVGIALQIALATIVNIVHFQNNNNNNYNTLFFQIQELIQIFTNLHGQQGYLPVLRRTNTSSSPCSLAGWGPSHLVAFFTFIVNALHLPLFSAMVFHS